MKKTYKYIIGFLIGIFVACAFVYASTVIESSFVSYNNVNDPTITDVNAALNDIYSKVDSQYQEGYNAGYNAGMQRFLDENSCDVEDGTLVYNSANGGATAYNIPCSGTYKIEYASASGGSGAGYNMGTAGSGGQEAGSPGRAYYVTAEFVKGQLLSYLVGSPGSNAYEVIPGQGGIYGGGNGVEGAYISDWAICAGAGGGGGGYTLIYIDGEAKLSAAGGKGGSGGYYPSSCSSRGGAGGAGGSYSVDSTGYDIVTVGNNSGKGYVRITLVEAKYHV